MHRANNAQKLTFIAFKGPRAVWQPLVHVVLWSRFSMFRMFRCLPPRTAWLH